MAVHIHWADILILVGLLLTSFFIGVYHACSGDKQRTTGDFIMANRKLKVIPTMMSLTMSTVSAIMVLGITSEIYLYGIAQAAWFLPAVLVGALVTERIIVPWLYPLKLVSVYDYLETRYDSKIVRYLGSILGILNGVLYIGVATFAPSVALEAVTGFSMYISMPLMSVLATVYTSIGGMRAVIWTDVFQGMVLIIGLLAVLIKALIVCGGFGDVFRVTIENGRTKLEDNLIPDPRARNTPLSVIVGYATTLVFMQGLQQPAVQRYSAVTSLKNARLVMVGNLLTSLVCNIVCVIIGVSLVCYFALIRCDPLKNKDIFSPNQLLPFFVMETFKELKGFTGLFMATLYSGALSSISSSLSGVAANIWEDLLKRRFENKLSEYQAAVLNKLLVVCCGIAGTGVAFLAAGAPGPVTQVCVMFFGACGGPLLGMYLMGGIFRCANWIGATTGGITSFAFLLWIGFGSLTVPPFTSPLPAVPTDGCLNSDNATFLLNFTQSVSNNNNTNNITVDFDQGSSGVTFLYQLSFLLYTPVGFIVCIIAGLLFSLCSRPFLVGKEKSEQIPDSYFINWKNIFSCSNTVNRPEETNGTHKIYRPHEDSCVKQSEVEKDQQMTLL